MCRDGRNGLVSGVVEHSSKDTTEIIKVSPVGTKTLGNEAQWKQNGKKEKVYNSSRLAQWHFLSTQINRATNETDCPRKTECFWQSSEDVCILWSLHLPTNLSHPASMGSRLRVQFPSTTPSRLPNVRMLSQCFNARILGWSSNKDLDCKPPEADVGEGMFSPLTGTWTYCPVSGVSAFFCWLDARTATIFFFPWLFSQFVATHLRIHFFNCQSNYQFSWFPFFTPYTSYFHVFLSNYIESHE